MDLANYNFSVIIYPSITVHLMYSDPLLKYNVDPTLILFDPLVHVQSPHPLHNTFYLIQERGGLNAFNHGSLTLRFKMDNEFDLVYVVRDCQCM